jgi:hypothetical protein
LKVEVVRVDLDRRQLDFRVVTDEPGGRAVETATPRRGRRGLRPGRRRRGDDGD